jgi:hypothetical protein
MQDKEEDSQKPQKEGLAPRRSPPREPVEDHVDPAVSSQDDSETLELALSQTVSARACLYWPSGELAHELGTAAKGFEGFLEFLQTQKDGDALIIGLCARLLGPEGLDPQEFFEKGKVDDPHVLAGLCLKTLGKHLSNVAKEGDGPELGHSRAVTIALLGDVGAFMAATGATTGTDRSPEVSRGLKTAFATYALALEGKDADEIGFQLIEKSVARCKELGGGEVVGPTKSKERKRVPGEEPIPRTGIHDCGKDADELLGRFEKEGHLVPTKWASARLNEERVRVTGEPLAGHMSASPSEILWTWDVLAGRGLRSAYIGTDRRGEPHSPARAAGACAFLVGCGYHSALEVLHGTMNYVGQKPEPVVLKEAAEMRKDQEEEVESLHVDAGAIFHSGAATSLVDELMDDMTSETGQAKKAPPEESIVEEAPIVEEEEQEASSLLDKLKANLGKVAIGLGLAAALAITAYAVSKNSGPK